MHPALRSTLNQRMTPQAVMQHVLPLHKGPNSPTAQMGSMRSNISPFKRPNSLSPQRAENGVTQLAPPTAMSMPPSRLASSAYNLPAGYSPFIVPDSKDGPLPPMRLPSSLTTEDFTRAVAVATVSALRHQRSIMGVGPSAIKKGNEGREETEEAGGHEAPSWTRGVSAGVLLGCTMLYALIAGQRSFALVQRADE